MLASVQRETQLKIYLSDLLTCWHPWVWASHSERTSVADNATGAIVVID